MAQRLKRLPPMRETLVQSLGRQDSLVKEMVTHSSILAWRIPWTEKPGRLQSMGSPGVGHDWATSLSFFLSFFLHIKVQYQLLNYTSKPFFLVLQKTPSGSRLDVRFSHEDIVQSYRCRRWCEIYALIIEHIEECSMYVIWALFITSS